MVAEGYKQTEVGVIPEEWEVKSIQSQCRESISYGIVQCGPNITNGVPYIRVSDMGDRRLDVSKMLRTSREIASKFKRSTVNSGDLVYALRGKLGLVREVSDQLEGSNLTQGTARIAASKEIHSSYLFWILQSSDSLKQAAGEAKGSTFIEITLADLRQIKIPLPPTLAEQKAIAGALTDADGLIESLEQLIEKKRQIKQGAMQELLSPWVKETKGKAERTKDKGTIPKLKEGWVEKTLGEVCGHFTTGKLDANEMNPDGEYRFYTCAKNYFYIDKYAFDTEALLISGNGANVGYIHYYHGKFNAYQRTYVLSSFSADIHFIRHLLGGKLALRILVEVNAGNMPYITMGTLTDMKLKVPSDMKEQVRIASVLSSIDYEIEGFETKLEKAKQLKQGMMQELLTGKIRLV